MMGPRAEPGVALAPGGGSETVSLGACLGQVAVGGGWGGSTYHPSFASLPGLGLGGVRAGVTGNPLTDRARRGELCV